VVPGGGEVARLHLHAPELVEGSGEVALGHGAGRVGFRQPFSDLKRAVEVGPGGGEVARLHLHAPRLSRERERSRWAPRLGCSATRRSASARACSNSTRACASRSWLSARSPRLFFCTISRRNRSASSSAPTRRVCCIAASRRWISLRTSAVPGIGSNLGKTPKSNSFVTSFADVSRSCASWVCSCASPR
jgi:hypothetical protein